MWENGSPCAQLMGVLTGAATVGNTVAVFKKLPHDTGIFEHVPKRSESRTGTGPL